MTHPDARIRTYRPIPPLSVWRVRVHPGNLPLWSWHCHLCGRGDIKALWRGVMAEGLKHMRTVHGCPSMRASGEPCDEYCADCGGKGWIK